MAKERVDFQIFCQEDQEGNYKIGFNFNDKDLDFFVSPFKDSDIYQTFNFIADALKSRLKKGLKG